jgi:hypothetical protein
LSVWLEECGELRGRQASARQAFMDSLHMCDQQFCHLPGRDRLVLPLFGKSSPGEGRRDGNTQGLAVAYAFTGSTALSSNSLCISSPFVKQFEQVFSQRKYINYNELNYWDAYCKLLCTYRLAALPYNIRSIKRNIYTQLQHTSTAMSSELHYFLILQEPIL